MLNSFSLEVVEFLKENYSQIIDKKNLESISISGSVARGYAQAGSDVDIVCIGCNIEKSKKSISFKNYNLEIHYYPTQYVTDILFVITSIFENGSILDDKIKYSKNEVALEDILLSWRKLKKISDSIILYEKNKYLTEVKMLVKKIKANKNIVCLLENSMKKTSNSESIINSLRVYSLMNGNVFSKVSWCDLYMKTDYSNTFGKVFTENINLDNVEIKQFSNLFNTKILPHLNSCFDIDNKKHIPYKLFIELENCVENLKKATTNKMKYGEFLAMLQTVECIKKINAKQEIIKISDIKDVQYLLDKVPSKLLDVMKKECL